MLVLKETLVNEKLTARNEKISLEEETVINANFYTFLFLTYLIKC